MSDSGKSSEDQNADRHGARKGCAHAVSDRNKPSLGNWSRNHLCYILAKNLPMFCPQPKTLWGTEFKGNKLINLAEEISTQPSIQALAWILLFYIARFIVRIGSKQQIRKS
jgi:hypothetical protein